MAPVSNYFNLVSSLVLGLLVGFLIDKLLEPRINRRVAGGIRREPVRKSEPPWRMGDEGWSAGLTFLVLALAVTALAVWPDSPLRNEAGQFLPESPLLDSVTTLTFAAFAVPGIVYGAITGVIGRAADVPKLMGASLRELTGFFVLAFMLGQFIALFNWTNLGALVAVGAELLKRSTWPVTRLSSASSCWLRCSTCSSSPGPACGR